MRRILVLGVLLAFISGFATAAADEPSTTETRGKLVLVLDSSGSMKERASGGQTKIAAARSALKQVVKNLPDNSQVGVRVFGAKVFSRKDKGACTDTQNVVPVGPLDRDKPSTRPPQPHSSCS